MPRKKILDRPPRYKRILKKFGEQKYVLRLYVPGASPVSTSAIAKLKAVCEGRLRGRFELEVIDILQRPELAKAAQVIAGPTLVKLLPLPMRRVVGKLSNLKGTLFALDVRPSPEVQDDPANQCRLCGAIRQPQKADPGRRDR